RGIYTSLNGGESWTKIYDGLTHKTYHSPVSEEHLVGIVFDSEVSQFMLIYSTDSGQTWESVGNIELLQTAATSATVKFQQESAEVFIGSIDLGLIKYTIDLNQLGLEPNHSAKNSLEFYPNPVKNTITLRNKLTIEKLAVYSISGQQLLVKNINALNAN